ncbi:hypothetical protein Pla108_10590 [Botrimarina colliarenosi]|uniref:Tetratricopeptide repeat protein n=1 Tax=Botrimarina colliarenosi TaxID=2528001 RepID=A0A5C6AJA8_9BACT|nr:hypothetical protein [Botrimarina colliarenosi]TWU00115.1 hypothetical protein Pla108_10590 [Botrimarina colliarenosi]
MSSRSRITATVLVTFAAGVAMAGDPYLPEDDEVLQTLPVAVLAGQSEVADLRRRLLKEPEDADLAAQVANAYVQLGKQGGGPRYYGYARAAIEPWWDESAPPAEILRVRAKLKETDHEYAAALEDIETLLQSRPRDSQAWIEAVNLHRVQGDYDAAWVACDQLSEFAEGVARVFCRVPLLAVTGGAEEAAGLIEQALPITKEKLPAVAPWLLTQQAETARALGRDDVAERAYREGLALDTNDGFLKRAYADFLLDRDRADEVAAMLGDDLSDNGYLLAAAIAARQTGDTARAAELRRELADRFRETRLRGDLPHGRFEARFALELEDNPQRALELALANWDRQKEARDTRNVLEAALAAQQPVAAAEAIGFLKEAGTQDVALQRLVEQLVEQLEAKP